MLNGATRSGPAATLRKTARASPLKSRRSLRKGCSSPRPIDELMRILVVEDEPAAAAVLAKGLREHSYAVDIAADGAAAMAQVSDADYDLVILDILLPRINGLDLCRRLREFGATVPI